MNEGGIQSSESLPSPRRPPPAPLLPVAIGLILGIAADNAMPMATWTSAALVAGGVALMLNRKSAQWAFAATLLAAAGAGSLRHAVADRCYPDNHVLFFTTAEPMLTKVQGLVIGSPYFVESEAAAARAYPTPPKTHFIIEAQHLAGKDGPISVSGKIGVSIKAPLLSLRTGDHVEMTGWVYRPRGPQNPGEYDWALHKRRNGLTVGMSCDHAESVIVLRPTGTGWWTRLLQRTRDRFRGFLLNDAFEQDDPGAGVISAMVLGARSAVPQAMNEAFIRTGNAHYLAASGMNVGWLAVTGWMLMRLLGVYYRTTAVFVGLLIVSYVLLAEPQPSILRAGIMGVLWCISVFLRGRANVLNWLACSAIVVLMIDPMDCFRPAFQYSFMAVLAILHLYPRLRTVIAEGLGPTRWAGLARFVDEKAYHVTLIESDAAPCSLVSGLAHRAAYGLVQMLVLSFAAWLATAPLCCYQFDQFTPWGAVGTFVLWFIAAPVTCWGYIMLLLGLLFPSSGVICGPVLKFGTNLMIDAVQLLARIPGTILDGRSPSIWLVLAVYLVMTIWAYRPIWLPRRHGVKILVLVLAVWWLIPPRLVRVPRDTLQAWMLAVGDGAATVAELPNGKVIVCDFGTRSGFDVGRVGVSFLKHQGMHRLDAIFVSHPNIDHFNGIEALAREFDIGKVIVNDHFERLAAKDSAASRFLPALRQTGIPIEVISGPRVFEQGKGVTVEAIWPPPASEAPYLDANNASTVLRIRYRDQAILLPGDIGEPAISQLLNRADLDASVLVLPHHGAVFRNTSRFIERVAPRILVRSSGQRRDPTSSGIEMFATGRSYFSTADLGCALVQIKEGSLVAKAATPRE